MTDTALRMALPAHDDTDPAEVDPTPYVKRGTNGAAQLVLLVDNLRCGACVQRIERSLQKLPGVHTARVNLTTKRLSLEWDDRVLGAREIARALGRLGYPSMPFNMAVGSGARDAEGRLLLRSMAVAGFAAANVMLLSVAIWSGAFNDMGEATRALFHWVSALIVLPAVAYAVRPFLASAWGGLRHGMLNMDLPITVGVLLTAGVSLFETMRGGQHAYFDAAASLLFFLLAGRVLDRQARARACAVAENLLTLRNTVATIVEDGDSLRSLPVANLRPGMILFVAAGARVPADAQVLQGRSDVDVSLVTGETAPQAVAPDDRLFAGTLNRTAALTARVIAAGDDTLLAEMVRLMDVAGQGRARYVRLADRVSRIYAPVVHIAALATFLLWTVVLGTAWQDALLIAVSVLIITCPCALGLAVPVVQVVATGRLLRRGVILKAADGLERLAAIDTVVFDKTGTLSLGDLRLANARAVAPADLALAASFAATSRHPLCRALVRAAPPVAVAAGIEEHPGEGLLLRRADGELRLGSRAWCGVAEDAESDAASAGSELWLAAPGRSPVAFRFTDQLRPDAAAVIAALKRRGLAIELLSGDRDGAVASAARAAGIDTWRAACKPADKIARLRALAADGHRVLMVGDGLNDAPALAAAYVSLSPASAADISLAAADGVFQGALLDPVREAYDVARRAQGLVHQNFALAIGYNLLAVPLAMAGVVTPLIAAIAMSSSSILVIANALRLHLGVRPS